MSRRRVGQVLLGQLLSSVAEPVQEHLRLALFGGCEQFALGGEVQATQSGGGSHQYSRYSIVVLAKVARVSSTASRATKGLQA